MSLKTFNEIVKDWNDDSENVRNEAIKHIKGLIKNIGKDFHCIKHDIAFGCTEDRCCNCLAGSDDVMCNADYEATDSSGAIKILKHFFNIKEEDLQ